MKGDDKSMTSSTEKKHTPNDDKSILKMKFICNSSIGNWIHARERLCLKSCSFSNANFFLCSSVWLYLTPFHGDIYPYSNIHFQTWFFHFRFLFYSICFFSCLFIWVTIFAYHLTIYLLSLNLMACVCLLVKRVYIYS